MAGAKSGRTGSDVLSLAGVIPVDSRETTTDFASVGELPELSARDARGGSVTVTRAFTSYASS